MPTETPGPAHGPFQVVRRGVFSAPASQPRFRRASDVVLALVALPLLALLVATYPPARFQQSLRTFIDAIPAWLDPVWGLVYDGLALWAITLFVFALVRRRSVALDALATAAATIGLTVLSTRLAVGRWPPLDDLLRLRVDETTFPLLRVALSTAVVVGVGPHLIRPLRRLGVWIVALGVTGAMALQPASPGATVASVVVALLATAIVRLALGTSVGHPETDLVRASLLELGVDTTELRAAERQPAGAFVASGTDPEGRRLLVKVYGRDAYDTQLLEKVRRTVLYHDDGPRARLTRGEAVEHEALFTLLAAQAGVLTRPVIAVGLSSADDAILVLGDDLERIGSIPAGEQGDDQLRAAWAALAALAAAGIVHHRLGPASLLTDGSRVGLADFGRATTARNETSVRADRAQLLAVTAALAGVERAVAAAIRALGADEFAATLPLLQPAGLSPELRRALRERQIDVDELREAAAAAVGVEAPKPLQLRRVTWWTIAQLALLAFAVSAVIGGLSGLDYTELWASVSDASWGWLAVGFVVAQLPRLTQAMSTQGSVPISLPFVPVYAMQLATGYLNLALPSNLARMAINIRFFQRHGVPPATAVTGGAIDSFASTVVQVLLLGCLLLFTSSSLPIDLEKPRGPGTTALIVIVVLALAGLVVLAAMPRVRTAVIERLRQWWPEVKATLRGLRAGNKLGLVIGASLATELLFALALGIVANAFGFDASFTDLLLINMSVSLLASVLPVPGGIGIVEFGITVGLSALGMAEEAALATAVVYRLSTFYIPPIWGFFAMRWLQRSGHL